MEGALEEFAAHVLPGEQGYVLPLNANPVVATNAVVVKSGQGVLYGFSVYSSLAGSQFVQMFMGNAIPADGTVPLMCWPIAGQGNVSVAWPLPGRAFKTGIVLCNSTTDTTKTIGAANCLFDVQYV